MPIFVISLIIGIGCGILYDKAKTKRKERKSVEQFKNVMLWEEFKDIYINRMDEINRKFDADKRLRR